MGFHGSRFTEVSKDAIHTIELIQARKQPPIGGGPQAALGSSAGSALASVLSHLPQPSKHIESGGLIDELKGRLAERILNAKLDHHLGNAGARREYRRAPRKTV
jgi:formiminotetrahydrofolate cyclodeaminase